MREQGASDRGARTLRLASETARVDVVGTQSYQDAIWRVVGEPAPGPGGRAHWRGDAYLVPEPGNAYDPAAVQVIVAGQVVGYLERILAARLQPALLRLKEDDVTVVVPCYARGGFVFRDGTRASVGLALRFDPHDLLEAAGAVDESRAA